MKYIKVRPSLYIYQSPGFTHWANIPVVVKQKVKYGDEKKLLEFN